MFSSDLFSIKLMLCPPVDGQGQQIVRRQSSIYGAPSMPLNCIDSKVALHDLETKPPESERLVADLRSINAKLTDAIKAVGISATLAERLTSLEQEKAELEDKIAVAASTKCADIKFLPDVQPALIQRWRVLVAKIEELSKNPATTSSDFDTARGYLHALLGPVTLEPRDGVLWAHPSPNAKSLVETRLSGRLHINNHLLQRGRDMHCSDSPITRSLEIAQICLIRDISAPRTPAQRVESKRTSLSGSPTEPDGALIPR
jgi:hypothetical protein